MITNADSMPQENVSTMSEYHFVCSSFDDSKDERRGSGTFS